MTERQRKVINNQRNKIVQRNQKRSHVNRNHKKVVNKTQRVENEIDLL